MLHRLILKVTKFQLPRPKRLGTVVENILGAIMPPPPQPCQIGLIQENNDLVSSCKICQEFRNCQSRETLLPREVPNEPWSKIGNDLFHLKGKT